MGFKKLFIGEAMPDREDPKYQKLHETMFRAGQRFAEATGLRWLMRRIRVYGYKNRKTFLAISFGTVLFFFVLHVGRMTMAAVHGFTPQDGVEHVDSMIHRELRSN